MKARKLLLIILTTISTVCTAQNAGSAHNADSVIIIRHDTTVVMRYDTVVRHVCDTLTAEKLVNLFISRQKPSPKTVDSTAILTANKMPMSRTSQQPDTTMLNAKGKKKFVRMDREIQKLTFIPKKTWFGGASISYNEQEYDNLNYLLIKDVNAKGYTFGVSPFVGYFVKDNMALGARFTYNRSLLDIGNLDLNLGEDFNINLKDMYYLEHDYQIAGFMRTYMPLLGSKIMGFFSEMRLTYGHSQAKILNGRYEDGTLDGTYSTSNYMHIGFAPGLTAFVQDWMSVEVQLGIMGFNFKWTEQVTNQVEHGTQRTFSGVFDIDLFSISIGTTIYI